MRIRTLGKAIVATALLFVSHSANTHAESGRTAPRTLRDLDLLFGTKGDVDAFVAGTRSEEETLRQFVRSRMQQDAFYETLLPRLFNAAGPAFVQDKYAPTPITLAHTTDGGEEYYHLADRPCPKTERVEVHPWWKMSTTVRVCKDAYRPEVKSFRLSSGVVQYCEASFVQSLDPASPCRCGENLLNCARDPRQYQQLVAAGEEEFVRTMQHVIANRKPFGSIFTMKETVRSDIGDFPYARNRFYKTGTLPPIGLATGQEVRPTLRPRDPEFEGGLLTSPRVLFIDGSRRTIVDAVWRDFLCLTGGSLRVEASQVFHVADPSLRSKEHVGLTTMFGCKDCHARLENASLTLRSFTPATNGNRFLPVGSESDQVGFFVRNAEDLRGRGPARPQWHGEMLVKQPEFAQCISKKVTELVFGEDGATEQVRTTLNEVFAKDQDFANLFETAIVLEHTRRKK